MDNFSKYADYYNLLYKNKDYNNEVEYLLSIINKHSTDYNSLLDLGCGTGNYTFIFEKHGFSNITGIDLSSNMINIANENKVINNSNITFIEQNIVSFFTEKKYDVIISMFDVISYLTENSDLIKLFNFIKNGLSEKGIFIFDFWYGPGVLTSLPETRYKIFENENIKVNKASLPKIHYASNLVDVNFEICTLDKKTRKYEEFKELHRMRYFFKNELTFMIQSIIPNANIEFTNWEHDLKQETPWHMICKVVFNN